MENEQSLTSVIASSLIKKGKDDYKLAATDDKAKVKKGKKSEKDLEELKKEVDLVSRIFIW